MFPNISLWKHTIEVLAGIAYNIYNAHEEKFRIFFFFENKGM